MKSIHGALLGGACTLALLSGCNYDVSSSGSTSASVASSGPATTAGGGSSGPVGLTTGTSGTAPANPVTATPSVAGTVSVVTGASQTITIAFTSSNGQPITGLSISNTTLPPDWSGPGNFTCPQTDSGSNCVLTLTYSPTAVETGTLNIGYVYVGDHLAPPGASVSIPYAAIASNNVIATAAPIGQINAVAGVGTQSVSVNFTTDDANTATALTVPGLSSLPAGWSTTTPAFSCAIISNGSGCQLVLGYAPKTAGSGTLVLNYGYVDGSGAARTGALNLSYSTTVNGNVVATVSPTGQVNAVQTAGTQAVKITFTTDNGQAARDLTLLSSLKSLPAGWSGASGFTCGSVSTGNGCQLTLTYAPTTLTSGTVSLNYGYTSPTGAFTTGSFNVPYAATTNDNVVATAAPSGELDAIVGEVDPDLAVTFTTDDLRTATNLQLTTDLTSLPAGWASTQSSFACAGVDSGATCQLPLTYTPTAAATGTMTLRYTYLNNAGQAKSGSLNVPYRSNTDDTIVGTPSATALSVVAGTSTMLSVTFATDDANPAGTLAVTSGLASLPAGWSSTTTTFTCATVSAGVTCLLPLTYAPTAAGNGTLRLGYTYLNNAGQSKSGLVNVPYHATTNDSVVATASPPSLSVTSGTSTMVAITFATDDGNPASLLSVTSGLSALPVGWTSTSGASFSCSAVSSGTVCQLVLTYLPTSADSGTLALGFSYTNDSGTVKSGAVSIPYTATP